MRKVADEFVFDAKAETTYEIQKTLCVSTGHITEEEAGKLTRMGLEIEQSQYCYVLYCEMPDGNEYSLEIQNLMSLARDLDCSWLKLDRDGPVLKDFPVFEW